MPNRLWTVAFEDGKHQIEFTQNNFTGQQKIKIDGLEVYKKRVQGMNIGSELPFRIGAHPCAVICRSNGFTSNFELKTDYIAVPPKPIPAWGWIVVVACGIIPVLTIGGAVPAGIGAGGGVGCYYILKGTNWGTSTKVMACIGVTILAWAVFIVFLSIVGQSRFLFK